MITNRLRYESWWRGFGYLLIATVIYLSLTRHPPEIDMKQGDKLGHFLAYGSMMFWFAQLERPLLKRLRWALMFIAMGIALEFLQGMTTYRSFDVFDMLANAVGVLLGWLLALPRHSDVFVRLETALTRDRSG